MRIFHDHRFHHHRAGPYRAVPRRRVILLVLLALAIHLIAGLVFFHQAARAQNIFEWRFEFPRTDFARRSISLGEIYTGGPRRDTIAPIYNPIFAPVGEIADIGPLEPVLSIGIDGDFRAYPLRILLYRELVNDVVGGVPVLVSYCPLCNSGVVYDRRLDGTVLTFGNAGRLRLMDMVMFDHQTESWWQQFLGEAIIGARTGQRLTPLPSRLESLQNFQARAPQGRVLIPPPGDRRPYGFSTDAGIDDLPLALTRERYPHDLPDGINPIARVVVVDGQAWTLDLVSRQGTIEAGDLVITWQPGQNSIHDTAIISDGRDIGNVVVQRRTAEGLADVPYDVSFAFAFSNFVPGGTLHR